MELFHVLNRGVDKRKIFMDDRDRFRFIHDLFQLNNADRVNNVFFKFHQPNDIASHYKRKLLVDIHAFCLMPNHYHLLLSPRVDKGISFFMKKINMAYAKYFNTRHKRTGALFEGRYKAVPITEQAHFIHIPYYIHFNPLDLVTPEWRNRSLSKSGKAIGFLKKYRWSSHLDYLGEKNFPSITNRKFLLDVFGGEKNYENSLHGWLKELEIEDLKKQLLE